MFLPPIVDRELRVASRRVATYRLRLIAALVMTVLWYVLMAGSWPVGPAQLGRHVFIALAILAMGGALCSGVFLTSDCLSEEKREGTLGLIFLANISGIDVVLGKLAATSMHAIFALLAVLPIIGLPVLMGGVPGSQFWHLILVLVTTLFWSLSIGLAVSAITNEAARSMGRCVLILLVLAGVFPVLWWCQNLASTTSPPNWLLLPSPCYALTKALDNSYALGPGATAFWNSLLCVALTGVSALGAAMICLPKAWQAPLLNELHRAERRTWLKGVPRARPLLDTAPSYWLSMRNDHAGLAASRLLFLVGFIWIGLLGYAFTFASRGQEPFIISFLILYGLHTVAKVLIAAESSRRMNEDRASGALELLLVTPLQIRAILHGHYAALRDQFRRPIRILVVMNLTMIAGVVLFHQKLSMQGSDQAVFVELFGCGILALIADFIALRWMGIHAGLTSRKHYRAVLRTVGKVLLPPWVCIFLMFFIRRHFNSAGEAAFMFALYIGFGLVLSLTTALLARSRLEGRFREMASERKDG
jgi:hypothetical protein